MAEESFLGNVYKCVVDRQYASRKHFWIFSKSDADAVLMAQKLEDGIELVSCDCVARNVYIDSQVIVDVKEGDLLTLPD